jgi:hypothetical protein
MIGGIVSLSGRSEEGIQPFRLSSVMPQSPDQRIDPPRGGRVLAPSLRKERQEEGFGLADEF